MAENTKSSQPISEKILLGSDQVTQVVTATTEMSSTVAEIARNAIDASSETEKVTQESIQRQEEVRGTISSINQLSTDLGNASEVIHELNNS
ncbi:MAG TPA: hypothetical protein EYH12_01360 [Psychromonas hadalis]|nr:hypothetical protein [Psychromonas hadalis]